MMVIMSRGSLMLNLALKGKTVNADRVRSSSKYIPVNKKFTQDEENQSYYVGLKKNNECACILQARVDSKQSTN
ncbi:uncharacterized protein LOC126892626 isoform X2 [Diabrotica virgifera virgifera]|uniref:Uncharacterized protein n=1 Tax=Diabrotica virgifera virgifera TaxID=50390 RepID=A0ABM5L6Y3_DIAVI|nr:uncharacterized protein LOC126892626 isoform X2 [Diabrotica virgifera virgifera]